MARFVSLFLFVLLAVAAITFSSCQSRKDQVCSHIETTSAALLPTCTEDGKTQSIYCSLCGEVLLSAEIIEKTGHSETVEGYIAPTCTDEGSSGKKVCSACGEILSLPKIIEPLGHIISNPDDFEPTCTSWGVHERAKCSVCQAVIEREFLKPTGHSYEYGKCTVCNFKIKDYSNLDLYVSAEGYMLFDTYKNGEAMQALYEEMSDVLREFHSNPELDAEYYRHNEKLGDLYTVAIFDYTKYGLSLEEAQTVFSLFRKDHPVFYWMSYWLYWNNGSLRVTTVKEYADGYDREEYNELVYQGIERYLMLAEGETDAYNIALIFYDAILDNNSYAKNSNGEPEGAQWAHSIIGAFTHESFVCEGYAKLFQLLLNVSCIDNRYIVGDANGSHSWNLVKTDDGNWYWFDLTWADNEGKRYKYFCVTDSAMTTHKPDPSDKFGLYYNFELPERGVAAYKSDEFLEIDETFIAYGAEYALCGAGKVRLKSPLAELTDRVAYKGRVYEVVR